MPEDNPYRYMQKLIEAMRKERAERSEAATRAFDEDIGRGLIPPNEPERAGIFVNPYGDLVGVSGAWPTTEEALSQYGDPYDETPEYGLRMGELGERLAGKAVTAMEESRFRKLLADSVREAMTPEYPTPRLPREQAKRSRLRRRVRGDVTEYYNEPED